jgi:hypothetical protein
MPFVMATTPKRCQQMINEILMHMIDLSVVAVINDIFIYSQTKKEHERLLNEVLIRL